MSSPGGSTPQKRRDREPTSGAGSRRASGKSARAGRQLVTHSRSGRISGPVRRLAAGAQKNLTLDASLVVAGFAQDGVESGATTPSLTSSNNFINFCDRYPDIPITNGQQLNSGSCNPAPMGEIPSASNLPSVRIAGPITGQIIAANTTFSLSLAVKNLADGVFVNPTENFLSAPQQLNSAGNVLGHYQVVIEELDASSTAPTDSRNFAFFSVVSAPGIGILVSSVTNGLPEGFYRITAAPHASNYQPVLAPVSDHGSLNDVAYITVTADGTPGSTSKVGRRVAAVSSSKLFYSPKSPARTFIRQVDPAQSSLTLLPSVIATKFGNNGQDNITVAGQSASLTSTNNYINFCGSSKLPLITGTFQETGFCNPSPMGVLPASTHMPSTRITYPRNGDTLAPNVPLEIGLAVTNLATGNLANQGTNYLTAPQTFSPDNNLIQGHPYIVIEAVSASSAATLTDPSLFYQFQGFSGVADPTGVLTTPVALGIPAGFYRLSAGIRATNGQPALVPLVQHGAIGDAIYFTVAKGGATPTNETAIIEATQVSAVSNSTVIVFSELTAMVKTTPGSSSATNSKPTTTVSPSATPVPQARTNVALAVGGALGGVAFSALLIVGIWFIRRRRQKLSRARTLMWRPAVLDIDGPPWPTPFSVGLPTGDRDTGSQTSMAEVQVGSPPSAFLPRKSRGSGGKRPDRYSDSAQSAAPSYRTYASI